MSQFYIEFASVSASNLHHALSGGGFFTIDDIFGRPQVYAACSDIMGQLGGVRFISAGPFLG